MEDIYNQIEKLQSTENFGFTRYCREKDLETVKELRKIRENNKSLLNTDNFKKGISGNEYKPVIVENVFNSSAHNLIKNFFEYGIKNDKYILGDSQSKRYKGSNELVSRLMQYEMLPLIEHIVGKKLKPTYTYLSFYNKGCDLPPHTDRAECEYTVSFIVDKPNYNWNIYVDPKKEPIKSKGRYIDYKTQENKNRCIKVDCNSNGLMMFNGIDHIHFREKLEADYYNVILFHYVVDTKFSKMEKIYLSHDPEIYIIDNFISDEDCDHFINISKNNLQRALVSGNGNGYESKGRSGQNCWLQHDKDKVTENIANRIAKLVEYPLENAESFQFIYYGKDQEYYNHCDAYSFDKSEKTARCILRGGQRIVTALVYLNNVEKGGHTRFSKLNINVEAKKGRILVFQNCIKGTNIVHNLTEHAGTPVIEGEKYAFNLWFRQQSKKIDYIHKYE